MADVTVQLSVKEAAENIVATRNLVNRGERLEESLRGVIETMSSSAQSQETSSDAMLSAVESLRELGVQLHSDGSVSGVNSSLVESSVDQDAYMSFLTDFFESLGEGAEAISATVDSAMVLGDVADDVSASVAALGESTASLSDGMDGAAESVGNLSSASLDAGEALASSVVDVVDAAEGFSNGIEGAVAATAMLSDEAESASSNLDEFAQSVDDVNDAIGSMTSSVGDLESAIDAASAGESHGSADAPDNESRSLFNKLVEAFGGSDSRFGSMLSSLEGRANNFAERLRGATGALGEGGFSGAIDAAGRGLESIGSKAGWVGAALAAVPIVLGAVEEGVDVYQSARDVAISQTGSADGIAGMTLGVREWLDARTQSMFSGLSEDDARVIQENLISGRAAFGSAEYREGQAFSANARLNFGLDASKASDLYVKAVMQGTTTVNELNFALESLQKTAQNTDSTMEQMLDSFTKTVDKLESKFGGAGADLGVDLAKLGLEGVDLENAGDLIMQAVAKGGGYGGYFTRSMGRFSEEGYQSGAAAGLASLDMLRRGMIGGPSAQQTLGLNLAGGKYRTIGEYLDQAFEDPDSMDWDEFEEALRAIQVYSPEDWLVFNSSIGIKPENEQYTAEGYRKAFENLFKKTQAGNTAGTQGEEGVREIGESYGSLNFVDVSGGDTYVADPNALWGMSIASNQMRAEQNKSVSDAILGDRFDENAARQSLNELISRGVVNPNDLKNLSDDAMYKILREVSNDFKESGESDWSRYVIKNAPRLSSAFGEYTSKFADVKSGREADKLSERLDINLTLSLAGDADEVLNRKVLNYQWRQGQDNAGD